MPEQPTTSVDNYDLNRVLARGRLYLLRKALEKLAYALAVYPFCRLFRGGASFVFQKKVLPYYCRQYNHTFANERAVEIPIILDLLNSFRGKRVLEVGDVMHHYGISGHKILDKYAVRSGVINEDIASYSPGSGFDLIICVSTLEHVGWDELPREPQKAAAALENLKQLLSPDGLLAVSVPAGYNSWLDKYLRDGKDLFTSSGALRRTSLLTWREGRVEELAGLAYDSPYSEANGVFFGFFRKAGTTDDNR